MHDHDDDAPYFIKSAGHCTRCGEPFGGNATAYMVREKIAWKFLLNDDLALTQLEIVPVCDACVTEREIEFTTVQGTCKGCGQRMKMNREWRGPICCSNRCRQRLRRAEKRGRSTRDMRTCAVCRDQFIAKRQDAKFCSNACRQRRYRRKSVANTNA
jgi:hypothetical protein